MRRLLWIVPLVALLALIGWRVVQKKATNAGGQAGGAPGGGGAPAGGGGGGGRGGRGGKGPSSVEVATAGPRELTFAVQALGSAASPQTVRLSPPTSGRITFLQAREGDRVTAGETLVRVDPTQVEGQVLQAQANVSEAQSKLAQAQATIGSSDVGIESAIRSGGATVSSAKAKLDQARKTLDAQVSAAVAAVAQQEAAAKSAQADVASAQAQIVANQATANAAEVRYQRTKSLFEGGFIAAQDVDDARAQAEAAKGQVKVAQQLEDANRAKVNQALAQKRSAEANVTVVRRQAQGGILTAQADLRSAQATLVAAQANRAQGGANRRNIEALQSSVRAAQGQLDAALAQRENTVLKSPIDGTITERTADPGTLAQPGTAVLTVQVVKRMFVEASFPVELASQIRTGMSATVAFDALPNQEFTGQVTDLNRAADAQSRQFSLRVLLPNDDERIRPGMFGQVRIVTRRAHPEVVVPLDALKTLEGKQVVAVLDKDDAVHLQEVAVGDRDEQGVEIKKGVQAGDKVVTVTLRALTDGQKVSVGDANAAPQSGKGGGRRKR